MDISPLSRFRPMLPVLFIFLFALTAAAAPAPEPGLLFYLSGDNGFTADFARGNPEPTMLNDVTIVKDGAKGPAFSNPHFTQLFAYEAPGNVYGERGTFAFFWRPRDPVGKTPFHIVQGGFNDGSDIQCNWMRIDYNGEGGFDAFVTDANLAVCVPSTTAEVRSVATTAEALPTASLPSPPR